MAVAYSDLYDYYNDDGFRNRVRVAVSVAADVIVAGDDNVAPFDQAAGAHDARLAWVKNANAFHPTENVVQAFWNAMLAANRDTTTTAIDGAGDTSVQNNVNAVVDVFAAGEAT